MTWVWAAAAALAMYGQDLVATWLVQAEAAYLPVRSALFLPLAANATYFFVCFLDYEGGTQGSSDLKFAWTGPSGYSIRYLLSAITTGGAGTNGFLRAAAGASVGTSGAGNTWGAVLTGTAGTGSTAGTLQLQWAQNTSSGTATIVHAGSVLAAWQIA